MSIADVATPLQALLYRHESYVADAEHDRKRMLENLEHLEQEKRSVEERNALTIDENRELLDQLESLNAALQESDSRILALTECLRSAEAQIDRLTGLAARTDLLNAQLARFEDEQAALQKTLAITKEDERTAMLRFQSAERTIASLQDQMDSIERDAREERERHIEVVGRMERRRAVEMELSTAAGRLKGAAASKTLPNDKSGSSVVSHFVKDILQDNANL
jgi:chromosome segregation ATPase